MRRHVAAGEFHEASTGFGIICRELHLFRLSSAVQPKVASRLSSVA